MSWEEQAGFENADDRDLGLYGKFKVERLNDPAGKHAGCRFFVLDPQHDPIARATVADYADRAFGQGYYRLAADLKIWLRNLEADDEHL